MKRIFNIVFLLALSPALAYAFGLGNLDSNSALNEPFDARIQLLSPTADELDSLKINLADSEAFARAKIDRPFLLSKLKFELRRSVDDGPDYIRVYSQDPIREPFLNFLVEVSWSQGRLFREYTVLLDPPLYDPNIRANEFTQVAESNNLVDVVSIDDPDHQVVYAEAYENFAKSSSEAPSSSYAPSIDYTGGDYGPITSSDTLWSIASEMRPDTSISVNKMMMALLRANPEAFIDQNINNLKRGQILRMPNESEINALSNAEALSEAKLHHSAWDRGSLDSSVSERPEVSSVPETPVSEPEEEVVVEEVDDTDAELKLVTADDVDEESEQVSSVESGSGEELVLAQESIQVLTQENIELKDRVLESDALLDDLKRLLSLKDDELAAIQEQMAAAQAEADMAEEEMMEEVEEEVTEVKEEIVEEAEEEVAEAEEMMEEVEEEVTEVEEEMEVVEIETAHESVGIMGMVNQYIAKAKELLLGNSVVGMAVAGILVLLIIIVIVMKFRKEPAETLNIDAMTEEFPDFDSGDLGDTGKDGLESEAVTRLPDSEAETAMPEESADFDIDLDEDLDDKTQLIAQEGTQELPVITQEETQELPAEAEDEEDPLQEVNTYLAFEQFDQAEEFVRNIINDNPDNPEYYTKLLEVFYTSGNKKSYEEAAKVLHDKFGESDENWNMAVAMWSEMSPNRALFEKADDDEDSVAETTGGGFVDVTADDEAGDNAGDLDFDIGGAGEEPAASAPEAEEILDITGSSEGEDLLDVTAAVELGDDIDPEAETVQPVFSEDVLDISGTGGEDLLELTTNEEAPGEDLLDVTAASNLDLDLDSEEDLLDVTAATSAGADSSELLDLDIEPEASAEAESNEIELDAPAESNEIVEFDLGDSGGDAQASAESSEDENVIDFDMTSDEDNEIELDVAAPEESESDDIGLELELDVGKPEVGESDDIGLELELDVGKPEVGEAEDAGLEIELDVPEETEEDEPIRLDVADDEEVLEDDISLDLSVDEVVSDEEDISLDLDMGTNEGEIELDLSIEEEETPKVSTEEAPEIDFDFSLEDDTDESTKAEEDIDLDGTVEIPKSALPVVDDDDDDDDDDHTVFVPRSAQPEEQTAEDEIATKLDLAKAYVELGDKDSAKTILDEVMVEGNDEQRKQAEDLLGQV